MPAAAPRKVKFAHDNAANFSRKSGGTVCARSSSPSFYGALRRPGSLASFPIPDFREGSELEEGDRGEEDIAREDEIPLV